MRAADFALICLFAVRGIGRAFRGNLVPALRETKWGVRRRRVAGSRVVVLTAVIVGTGAGVARAQTPVPFDSARPQVFVAQGDPTQLDSALSESGGAVTFSPVGSTVPGLEYNAIGYDTCDNFIYAVETSPTKGEIIQIDSTGAAADTGINVGAAFNAGAFGPDANCDDFYVGSAGEDFMDKVDLTSSPPSSGTVTQIAVGTAAPDMTYSDGFFWSMPAAGEIERIDVAQMTTATFSVSTPDVGGVSPSGSFGAAWTYGNGNVGFSNNSTGNIYELAIVDPASAAPVFTTVRSQSGPASSNNDGTSSPGASTDLGTTVSASPAIADPGEAVTLTLTVTNNGPGDSSGYAVSDPLPDGLANDAPASAGCAIADGTLECVGGPLADGASAAYSFTAVAPGSGQFSTPITDTATVTANENDPDPGNDSASATITLARVAVSIVTGAQVAPAGDQGAVQVGDAISYNYRVTNMGNVPLAAVSVSDSHVEAVDCPVPAAPGLAPGATETCTAAAPYVVSQADVDAGAVLDASTAIGTDAYGTSSAPSPTSSVSVAAVVPSPSISVVRTFAVDPAADQSSPQVGDTISYSYVVTNTGNVSLSSVSVNDPTAGAVSCPAAPAPGLAPGQSEICHAEQAHTVTQSDLTGGSQPASAAIGIATTSPSAPASTTAVARAPSGAQLTITQRADHPRTHPGGRLTFVLIVRNTGPASLADVNLTENLSAALRLVSVRASRGECRVRAEVMCALGTLAAGARASVTVQATALTPGSVRSTATVASSRGGPRSTATVHARVARRQPETAHVTSSGHTKFTRGKDVP